MNRSFISLIVSFTAAIILIIVALMYIRPTMEAAAINERARTLRAAATYTSALAEEMLDDWFVVIRSTGRAINAQPREGEILLRSLLDQHADLLAARVSSPGSSDELLVARRQFVIDSVTFLGSGWFSWDEDTSVLGAIASRGNAPTLIRVQTRLLIEKNEYFLTTVWDGQSFERLLSSFPLDPSAQMHLMGPSGIVWKSWKTDSAGLEPRDRLTERFAKFPLKMTIAFPVEGVITPVRTALRDTLITALVLMLSLGAIGYWMTRKS